uniref:F-box protein n=1 Tax=Mammaliicoccus sciuri TaxID=1296 RepID=UPI00374CDBB9
MPSYVSCTSLFSLGHLLIHILSYLSLQIRLQTSFLCPQIYQIFQLLFHQYLCL